jgi:hypothetical protein
MDRSSQRTEALRQASTCLLLLVIGCGNRQPDVPGFLQVVHEGMVVGKVGEPMSVRLRAVGGDPPYLWSRNGSVAGLRLEDSGGEEAMLTGTPENPGLFFVTINAEDVNGAAGSTNFTLEIAPNFPPPGFETESLNPAVVGNYYSATLRVTGGEEPVYLTVGALPDGLVYDDPSRAIYGRAMYVGTYVIHARAEDAIQRVVEADFTLDVVPKLEIVTSSLAAARVNVPYRVELEATGGVPPYQWDAVLPPGMTLFDGAIEGTPTALGSVELSVEVTDASAQIATQFLTLEVLP